MEVKATSKYSIRWKRDVIEIVFPVLPLHKSYPIIVMFPFFIKTRQEFCVLKQSEAFHMQNPQPYCWIASHQNAYNLCIMLETYRQKGGRR